VSSDNAGISAYNSALGTTNLGIFYSHGTSDEYWRVSGVEIVGLVAPSNYTGPIVLHRTIVELRTYNDNNSTPSQIVTNVDDTSDPQLRDDDPQSGGSGGKVYDLDAPGIGLLGSAPYGAIFRRRVNFSAYAVVGYGHHTSSNILNWYARESVIKTTSGDQLLYDIPGDNVVGTGTTNLTLNLQ
jgi:hypothetical protein